MTTTAWPKTVTEAVDLMLDRLTPESRDKLKKLTPGELPSLHFTLGVQVRNACGLSQGNESLYKDTMAPGDLASLAIIEALWHRLNGRPEPVRQPRMSSFAPSLQGKQNAKWHFFVLKEE